MELPKHIKTLGLTIADLVFPVYCVVCGKDGVFLCADCQNKLPRLENQLCVVCKKPAPYGKTHPDCVNKKVVDGLISALTYTNPDTQRLIGTFKYKFIHGLAEPLSQMIVEAIANQQLGDYFADFVIVPVPLHKRRKSWRGFNQAELLSEALGRNLKINVNKNLVSRIKFTEPQTTLKADARKSNIENAFNVTEPVSGKYLLVDDVVTTGSTINEIAKLLKKHGAQEVWGVTVAHG